MRMPEISGVLFFLIKETQDTINGGNADCISTMHDFLRGFPFEIVHRACEIFIPLKVDYNQFIMRRFISLIFLVFVLSEIFGQRPSIALTFSAVNNTTWVQLDSIKVMNRTQGGDTVLYYPDTVLVLDYLVGMPEPHKTVEGFQVFQNYPNPAADRPPSTSMYHQRTT